MQCVGVDAHIDPLGTIEFAAERRVSSVPDAWADVGIGPCEVFSNLFSNTIRRFFLWLN